uniref:F-box domain-containing protein n=1 Tax=Mycena chlorophos TaxID=658473 RepID=A0ABQ0M128_MYCCL|nr:predicted protein [Mycena chlorophos]
MRYWSLSVSLSSHRPARPTLNTITAIDVRLQVAVLHTEIFALRAKRNTLVPIYKLPNEILARIIEFFAYNNGQRPADALFDLSWTRVLYVSRWWHEVGRAQRRFWSFLSVSRPYRIGVQRHQYRLANQVARSGVVPLSVRMSLNGNDGVAEWILNEYSTRIRALDFDGPNDDVHEIFSTLFKYPLRTLRSLQLTHSSGISNPSIVFPDEFLLGTLPELRELSLSRVTISWSLIRGLERLKLDNCPNSSSEAPTSIGDVLRLARASPNLTALSLVPQDTFDALLGSPFTPVSLPFLEFLYIKDEVSPITLLLSFLRMPPTAALQLFPFDVYIGLHIKGILVPLRKHIRQSPQPTDLRAMKLNTSLGKLENTTLLRYTIQLLQSPSSPSFPTSTLDYDYVSPSPSGQPMLVFNSYPLKERALRQVTRKFLHATRAELITHLNARAAYHLGEPSWRSMLRLLPALEFLSTEVYQPSKQIRSAVSLLSALTKLDYGATRLRALELVIRKQPTPVYPRYPDLVTMAEAEWLEPVVAALEDFVRRRRRDYDDPSAAASQSIPFESLEIYDERRFLASEKLEVGTMAIRRVMEGMGELVFNRAYLGYEVELGKLWQSTRVEFDPL